MLPEDLTLRVIREDEVIARANNLLVGRACLRDPPSGSIRGHDPVPGLGPRIIATSDRELAMTRTYPQRAEGHKHVLILA